MRHSIVAAHPGEPSLTMRWRAPRCGIWPAWRIALQHRLRARYRAWGKHRPLLVRRTQRVRSRLRF